MSKNTKSICIWVCLLLLLIILCTLTHMNSIKPSEPIEINAPIVATPVVKEPINFTIQKEGDTLTLSGNFSSQLNSSALMSALGEKASKKELNYNTELKNGDEVIQLTKQLIVPFLDKYTQGSISYQDEKLVVEGLVKEEADQNLISQILVNSTIASVDNTKIIPGPTPEELAEIKRAEDEAKAKQEREKAEKERAEAEKARIEAEAKVAQERQEAEKARIEAEAKAEQERQEAEKARAEIEAKAKIIEAEIKKVIDFKNINFELGKADLTPKSLETIDKITKILKEHPNVKVEIGGHTDSQGDDAYNLKLSQSRVDSVKKLLVELGISDERLSSIGYGETKPLVSNDTEENRQTNRRVEFKIIGE